MWNEEDFDYRVNSNTDIIGKFILRCGTGGARVYAGGFEIDVTLAKGITLTPSDFFALSTDAREPWIRDQLPGLAFRYEATIGPWQISDRNRIIGVLSGNENFWIYQNRPRISWTWNVEHPASGLFIWDEVSYFSDRHDWPQNRLAVGSRVAINRCLAFDLYALRQLANQSLPRTINGVGLTIEIGLQRC